MIVENALAQDEWEQDLPASGTVELLERVERVQGSCDAVSRELVILERLVGELGTAACATLQLFGAWLAQDPVNREPGEDAEDAAERIANTYELGGRALWTVAETTCQSLAAAEPKAMREATELVDIAAAIDFWTAWTTRAGGRVGDPWTPPKHQQQAVLAWAKAHGCSSRVALATLLDLGQLVAEGGRGGRVPSWGLPEVTGSVGRVEARVDGLRDRLQGLSERLGLIGSSNLGIPIALIRWYAQDREARLEVLTAAGRPLTDEEIEERIRDRYYGEGLAAWKAVLAEVLDDAREDLGLEAGEEWWDDPNVYAYADDDDDEEDAD